MERSVTESETPLQPLALPKRIMQTLILTENGALDPAATAAASPQPTSDDHDYSYLDDEEQVGNRYFIEEQNTPDRFGRRRTLEIVCFTCGSEDHRASACPVSQDVCFNCKERGHVSRDCNRPKLRGDRCGQCGSPYHHRSECPLIWRQYVYVDRVDKSLIEQFPLRRPVGAYCYQCAGRGHWGDDCLETGRNRLAYREFSAFNAHIETMPDFHPDADQVNAEIRRARPRRSQQTPPSAKRHYRPSHLADTPPSSSSRYRPPGKRHRPDYDASSPAPYEREYGRSSRHSKNSRPSPREDRHSRSSHPGLQYRTQDDRYYFPRGGHHDNDRSKDGGNSHASRSSRQQRPRSSRHHGMTISGASRSKRRSGRSSSRAHGSRQ
ncbi:hypothetical protein H4R34_005885 [Dimargaris verticillata]|uniref:CCHC-type domain-containing protein n=1 Tax=Dimargaris verticillata TaxID=2761393 RepID=A0A9W8E5R0_9FUNG|nr:hypothetical protein H4R34_005885 [Dimargaris verticillata]